MIRNIKNIRLIVILILLVMVYAGIKLFRQTDRSGSFRETLVNIDTSKVSRLKITKPDHSFEIIKSGNDWQVSIGEDKLVGATASSVNNALATLMGIRPNRIVSRDPEKWKDYQVDTAGTKVEIYEGNKKSLDLIIGRFGVQGRQQFHTFVRLDGDREVYVSENFMGITFPSEPNSFRNTRFLQMETDDINLITFHYPADSSFILNSQDGKWYIGAHEADSAQVAGYLSDLQYIPASNFVDDVDPAILVNPILMVEIQQIEKENIHLKAFMHPQYEFIYHSSYNPQSYFTDDNLMGRLFISRDSLLNSRQ